MRKILLLFSLFCFFSCSKNDYLDASIDEATLEFTSVRVQEVIPFIAGDEYDIAVPLQVFGGSVSAGAEVSVTVETQLSSDAYTVAALKTLEAGVVLDTIYVHVKTDKLKKGVDYTIQLSIASSDVTVATNYASCAVTFSQQEFIDFFTGTYSCFESSTNATYLVEFTKLNATATKNMNFWDFPLSGQYVPFEFQQDESYAVSIPDDSEWTDLLGNTYLVSGSGQYTLDGNFYVDFVMKDAATQSVYQTGRQTYTRK